MRAFDPKTSRVRILEVEDDGDVFVPVPGVEYGTVTHADPEKKRSHVSLYKDILFDTRLSPQAIKLYLVFKSYAWECEHNKGVFPGQERLARQMGVSQRSVRTYTDELALSGLIRISQTGWNRTNSYVLTDHVNPDYTPKQ